MVRVIESDDPAEWVDEDGNPWPVLDLASMTEEEGVRVLVEDFDTCADFAWSMVRAAHGQDPLPSGAIDEGAVPAASGNAA